MKHEYEVFCRLSIENLVSYIVGPFIDDDTFTDDMKWRMISIINLKSTNTYSMDHIQQRY